MLGHNPEELMEALKQPDNQYLSIHAKNQMDLLAHGDVFPNASDVVELNRLVWEFIEVRLTTDQTLRVLSMYPFVRAELAISCNAADIRDVFLECLSHFLLGCSWPGEKIEEGRYVRMPDFSKLLQDQITLMKL